MPNKDSPYPRSLRRVLQKSQSKTKKKRPAVSKLSRHRKLMEEVWKFFELKAGDWKGLAQALLVRHVGAFREDRRGRPSAKIEISDQEWDAFHEAGGQGDEDDAMAFVQASLVLAVQSEAKKRGGFEAAYRHLHKSDRLPERYRGSVSAARFKQEFLKVAREIKNDPKAFVPGTPERRARLAAEAEENAGPQGANRKATRNE